MPDDPFREFLDAFGTDLKLIHKEVSTEYEPAAYVRKSLDVNGPAFLFDNVRGYPGWRIAAGVLASRGRVARAMSTTVQKVAPAFGSAVKNPIPPSIVGGGPCKEVVWKGGDADLAKVPIVRQSEKDPAPFITSGIVVGKDPETGVRGFGIHRLQVKGKDRLGIAITGQRRLLQYFLKNERKGKPLDVAIAVGIDPTISLASQAKVPHDFDKFGIAGGLKGRPVSLTNCETVDLEVPAEAEVVVEGELLPGVREPEGPFGEFTGTYAGGVRDLPVIRVKAITMRRDPIYVPALAGVPPDEDFLMAWPGLSAVAYEAARAGCPTVRAVNMINMFYFVVVSIDKRNEGEQWNVISAVLGSTVYGKFCMVVDDDINIFSNDDVLWALQTRVQPNEGIQVFPVMAGVSLDPSAPVNWQSSKLGIDATIPLDRPHDRYEKVRVPGADEVSW